MPAEPQMCKELSLMDRENFRNGFELHNDGFLDEQIDSIARLQLDILIRDRQLDLRPNTKAAFTKLICQTHLIGALQQSRT